MLWPWLQIFTIIPQPCLEITWSLIFQNWGCKLVSCIGSIILFHNLNSPKWEEHNEIIDIIHVGVYSCFPLLIFKIRCGTVCLYTPLNLMLGAIPFEIGTWVLVLMSWFFTRNYSREHRSWVQLLQGTKTGCGLVKHKKCIIMFCRKTSVMLLSSHITPYWHSSD